MKPRMVLLGLAAALACFGAGIAFQRCSATPPPPAGSASPSPALPFDAGALRLELGQDAGGKGPKLIFDPNSIELLPDASLRLDLPPGFDAGSAP